MDKRTVASAHERIDTIEKQIVAMKTEMDIQFNGTQRDRVSGRALTSTTMLMVNDFMST